MADVAEAWNPVADDSLPQYVAVNSRYVFDNPYGDVPVRVKAYVRSVSAGVTEWFDARWVFIQGQGSAGVHGDTLGLNEIVVQTGSVGFSQSAGGQMTGSASSGAIPSTTADLQVMVLVEKL